MFLEEVYIDKNLIKKRFSRSIPTYNQHAIVQQQIATDLMDRLMQMSNISFDRVLEIGCGTGFFTSLIIEKKKPKQFFVNDLIADFEFLIRAKASQLNFDDIFFIPGDIQNVAIPSQLDCIVSTSTFQWLQHLPHFLRMLKTALKPNGILAFSTFGTNNFLEINDIEKQGLTYPDFDLFKNELASCFELEYAASNQMTLYFDSALEVLKHLKNTGVNGISKQNWTKKRLADFQTQYTQKYHSHRGISLTYHPICFILKNNSECFTSYQ